MRIRWNVILLLASFVVVFNTMTDAASAVVAKESFCADMNERYAALAGEIDGVEGVERVFVDSAWELRVVNRRIRQTNLLIVMQTMGCDLTEVIRVEVRP